MMVQILYAIKPGKVITYDRNYVTNEILDRTCIKVHVIPSVNYQEVRGGPRCMSMPFREEELILDNKNVY